MTVAPVHPAPGVTATDTIMALASGSGRAAVAVLRLSGPECGPVLDRLCGRPAPRRASLRALREPGPGPGGSKSQEPEPQGPESQRSESHEPTPQGPASPGSGSKHPGSDGPEPGDQESGAVGLDEPRGPVLDRAVVLWLPGPGSYTGEDCAELHLHGGAAVIAAVSAALARLGVRPAEPGEFTRRAVLAGRMDLLAAEGVADLVAAESEAQRRQALRQMEGGLGRRLAGWADRLRVVLAQQEALIDFPDEDLPPEVEAMLLAEVAALCTQMRQGLADGAAGERVRDGLVVAVAGAPDVGKSSLVNALAGREVAIVSAGPGTTRDVLEVALDVAGVRVALLDTAGLRETADPVEAEGVRRARARAATADLVILVRDARAGDGAEAATPGNGPVPSPPTLLVLSKADLAPDGVPGPGLRVSARTGLGLPELRARLEQEVARLTATGGVPLTRARHRAALGEAVAALERGAAAAWPELRGEELRLALRAVGRITGEVDVEALLDTVFSRFCIGK